MDNFKLGLSILIGLMTLFSVCAIHIVNIRIYKRELLRTVYIGLILNFIHTLSVNHNIKYSAYLHWIMGALLLISFFKAIINGEFKRESFEENKRISQTYKKQLIMLLVGFVLFSFIAAVIVPIGVDFALR